MPKVLSLKEVRERLRGDGLTVPEVAKQIGADTPLVYGVLSGRLKGARGEARRIAVRLGLRQETREVSDVIEELRRAGGAK